MVVMGMIIGRSPTPLNSSRTLRAVGRREAVRAMTTRAGRCRMSVENVRGVVMSGGSPRDMKIWYSATAGR